MNKTAHKIVYTFQISFNEDNIVTNFTGESVSFEKAEKDAVIRPRHVKIVSDLQQIMKRIREEL